MKSDEKEKINQNLILSIGILILVIGISFAVGTYAYYQNTLNGNATGTTLGYTCEGNGETNFVINDISDLYPGSSEVRNISLTASIYSTATIEVTGYSNMNDSIRPNLALYNDSEHANKMLADGTNAITAEIYPGVATTIPIYVYWSYGNAIENYSETTPSASIKITCSQGVDNHATTLISRATPEIAGAHRYIGPVANNYVYFNGNELWRIIGVYGNNLKIMRAASIGKKQYNAATTDGNVWDGSALETYLNQETSGGYYYSLTQTAKDMIVEGTWSVGASSHTPKPSAAYTNAKVTQVTKKVGLMAAYEYLYAASDNCHSIAGYPFTGCTSSSWMKLGSAEWTLNPNTTSTRALYITSGAVYRASVNGSYAVRPVVYLKSDVRIVSGTGESGNPYVLE